MASQIRVADLDETDPKTIVNAKLLKIKSEKERLPYESESDNNSEDEYASPPRQQQFYQDLDNGLSGLPREMYVLELINLCKNDYNRINDYRIRLADRAKGFPDCPESRLVNRRNSSQTSRERKCANDCYIINAFINGERTKEIHEVFSNSLQSVSNNETVIIDDSPEETEFIAEFIKPNAMAILTRIQADVTEISKKQKADSILLNDLRSDIKEITVSFRIFHGHLNSILSRMPNDTTSSHVTKLQNDVSKLSSSLAIMNKRLLDGPMVAENRHPQPADSQSQHTVKENTSTNIEVAETSTYANATKRTTEKPNTPATPTNATLPTDNDCSKNVNANYSIKLSCATKLDNKRTTDKSYEQTGHIENTSRNDNHEDSGWKFISAKRRRTNSYFIGNIDASVDESDIRDYLSDQNIRPARLTMFYGKYGSSARVNIYIDDVYKVESETFWPEGVTCRKWVNKSTYERDSRRKTSYRDRSRYDSRYRDHRYDDSHDYEYEDQRTIVGDYNRDNNTTRSLWLSSSRLK